MDSYAAGGGLRGAGMFSYLKESLLSCAWNSVIRYHSSEVGLRSILSWGN